jgi:CheY-like chemotaxis protein
MERDLLQPLRQSSSESHSGDQFKVLVVDDEESIRSLLAEWLHVDGYTVLCAADGAEALDVFSAHNPSAVVTDLSMPRMNGLVLSCSDI